MAKPTVVQSSAQAEQQVRLPIVDNPSAPDVYADEVLGFLLANNTLRITLASVRTDHTKNPNANSMVVTNRLVLPLQAVQKLHHMLGQMLENVRSASHEQSTEARTLQ